MLLFNVSKCKFSDLVCFTCLQAKALVDPFAYEEYIEQRKREKLEKELASRITVSYFYPCIKCMDMCVSLFNVHVIGTFNSVTRKVGFG